MGTVTSNSGKQTPFLPKLLTVTLLLVFRTNNTGHCKMGNSVSAGNGGQVEQDKLDEANQLKEEYDQLRRARSASRSPTSGKASSDSLPRTRRRSVKRRRS